MPKVVFNEKETLASGESVINASGNIYIDKGRKYVGKRVRWVILKDEGSETPIVLKSTTPHYKCEACVQEDG